MAKLVAILATTHHPFFYRASTTPPESWPDLADEWVRKVTTYRETLTRARPDVLVMVGSDHFHSNARCAISDQTPWPTGQGVVF
jgi:protocatechuate 4,5-dioxygenase beta chain